MKLAPRAFHILWDVHAWGGALASVALFVMFWAGGFALFRRELDAWSSPACERRRDAAPAYATLRAQLRDAERVAFSPDPTGLRVYVTRGGHDQTLCWAPAEQRLIPVPAELGSFLYKLHYLEPLPLGIYVAGVAGLALFVAVVTGVLILLKERVRHWFRLRARGTARVVASDAHKLLGIVGLPYQLWYAWTGAMLCLGFVLLQPAFDRGGARDATPVVEPLPPPADPTSLDTLVASAARAIPGFRVTWIAPAADAAEGRRGSVDLYGEVDSMAFGYGHIAVRANDGAFIQVQSPGHATAFSRFEAWFYGIHYARFGGVAVRVVFAVLALATCVVIVTGNLVWLERRDRRRAIRGHRALARATVGGCGGVMVATLALLVAGVSAFWMVWLAAAIAPFALGYDVRLQSRQRPRSS